MSFEAITNVANLIIILASISIFGGLKYKDQMREWVFQKTGKRHDFAVFPGIPIGSLAVMTASAAVNLYTNIESPEDPSPVPDYAVVRVYYGTDRAKTNTSGPKEMFVAERGEMSLGHCDVSIPRDHRLGELEAPSVFRFEFRENPEKHVVLLDVVPVSPKKFIENIRQRTEESKEKEALVFVHGYNVTFEDAARRTAQMAYDLAFDGPSAFFSWPSKAEYKGYPADEVSIKWATPHIEEYLRMVALESGAKTVHVIAHSMGNRGVTAALNNIAKSESLNLKNKFQQIILAAPDIDKDIFVRDIFPRLSKLPARITLYASSRDKALIASKEFHQYPRAGDAGDGLVVLKGLDTVDATNVDTSFLGHSYYAENRSVISDMYYVVGENLPPKERFGLEMVKQSFGKYWRIKH